MNRFSRLAILSLRSSTRGLHIPKTSMKLSFHLTKYQMPLNYAIRSFGDHSHDGHHGDGEGEV